MDEMEKRHLKAVPHEEIEEACKRISDVLGAINDIPVDMNHDNRFMAPFAYGVLEKVRDRLIEATYKG